MHILVTGASGFVGSALVDRLLRDPDPHVHAAVHNLAGFKAPQGIAGVFAIELSADGNWGNALEKVDVVIHCAARAHIVNDRASDALEQYRRVNVEGTLNLARQAQAAGARRFVFISSIKVNGNETLPGRPFQADGTATPQDPFGISKMEAEQGLLALAKDGTMEIVIIRPALAYGPAVKANFLSMMRWVDKGIPLPLGAINANRRSLVALDNLVDLICVCMTHPRAAGEVFLAADGEDVSTTMLLKRIAHALGKRSMLLPVPDAILAATARILGRPSAVLPLCGSLQADIEKNRELLGWAPPVTMADGLKRAADAYLRGR